MWGSATESHELVSPHENTQISAPSEHDKSVPCDAMQQYGMVGTDRRPGGYPGWWGRVGGYRGGMGTRWVGTGTGSSLALTTPYLGRPWLSVWVLGQAWLSVRVLGQAWLLPPVSRARPGSCLLSLGPGLAPAGLMSH